MATHDASQKPPVGFYIVTFLVPIALFTLIETGLRLANVGHDVPLFIDAQQADGYIHVNPELVSRYVGKGPNAPDVAADISLIKREKANGTFRIVVQGGSTAAGFPYGRTASLQGMLSHRFKRLYPDRQIEVISTAMAAVNSYTLLDLVDDIIAHQPDLVLIYAGHNEYVGIMGVGSRFASSHQRWLTLTLIQARKLRLFQVLEQLLSKEKQQKDTNDKRTLMAKIVDDAEIALGSDQYHAGVDQFESNLNAILKRYQSAEIPVLVGNLVSNEKDQIPFSTVGSTDWSTVIAKINERSAASNLTGLQSHPDIDSSAALKFELGLNHLALSHTELARTALQRARDLDQLRFRAPGDFNRIIERVAQQTGAILVDVDAMFRSEADNGILGEQHLLEHVHPNERGYFLLAEAFAQRIQQSGIIAATANPYSRSQAWLDNPITKVDRLGAQYTIDRLRNDYPFTHIPKNVPQPSTATLEGEALSVQGAGIDWRDYRLELMRRYVEIDDLHEAARIAAGTSDVLVNDTKLAAIAGQQYLMLADFGMARYYFQRATRLDSNNQQAWLGLAETLFKLGERDQSEQILLMLKN